MAKIKLPKEITLGKELGSGRRSQVYSANYKDQPVVVKIYKPAYIDKYQRQYNVNIAAFEYERNKTMFDSPQLKRHCAQPYAVFSPEQGYSLAFVQEFIEGVWLEDLAIQMKGLPTEVLEAGYYIVEEASKLGLYDLDICLGNIRVQKNAVGKWVPKLFDFNLVPQHMSPPNPFMALGFLLGLRKKNHRDYRSLKSWEKFSQSARDR